MYSILLLTSEVNDRSLSYLHIVYDAQQVTFLPSYAVSALVIPGKALLVLCFNTFHERTMSSSSSSSLSRWCVFINQLTKRIIKLRAKIKKHLLETSTVFANEH